uniref:Uncharacterized protein n=1 Tax=Sphaerodactylus townsendi TaxID=933632 RepID=A0ACB8FCA0_9SAUR
MLQKDIHARCASQSEPEFRGQTVLSSTTDCGCHKTLPFQKLLSSQEKTGSHRERITVSVPVSFPLYLHLRDESTESDKLAEDMGGLTKQVYKSPIMPFCFLT